MHFGFVVDKEHARIRSTSVVAVTLAADIIGLHIVCKVVNIAYTVRVDWLSHTFSPTWFDTMI